MREVIGSIIITLLITVGIVFYELKRNDPAELCVSAVRTYLEGEAVNLKELELVPDTNNQSWEEMNALFGISGNEIYQILPKGVTVEDLQVISARPIDKESVKVLYFVNRHNYQVLGSLGEY